MAALDCANKELTRLFWIISYTHEVQTAIAGHEFPNPPVVGAATLPTLALVQQIVQAEGWEWVQADATSLQMHIPFLHHEQGGTSITTWSWDNESIAVDNGIFSGLLYLLHQLTLHSGALCCWASSGHPVFVVEPAMDWVTLSKLFATKDSLAHALFYQHLNQLYSTTS